MRILKDLQYTKEHEWIRREDDLAFIGITDYAQEQLGDIVFVELPEVGDDYVEGDSFAVVDSVKATSDIYMPLDAQIVEINEELLNAPELINEEPYENWLIKAKIADLDQLDNLITAEEYERFCAEGE